MPVKDSVHVVRMAAAALAAGPADDPRTIARWTASRNLWLTPRVVDGFGHHQLIFMPDHQAQDVLPRLHQYAAKTVVLADREPTPENVATAAVTLADILGPVAAAVSQPEGEAVVRALWAASVPDFVLTLDYTLGTDWSGDPAVHIWVIVRDDADPESDEFQDFADEFRDRAWKALAVAGSDRIPYVRFRTESEAKAGLAGGGP